MKLKNNIFIYLVIMVSTIVLFQVFFEYIIKDKQGNKIFKSQIMVKCNQVENIEINLDCENFLNIVGEEVYTKLVFEKKNKIETERMGFAKVFTFTTLNQRENEKILKELNDEIEFEANSYFLYVKKRNYDSLIREKSLMFLTYGSKDKLNNELTSALEFLESLQNKSLKYLKKVNIENLYKIVVTDKSSYQRNKFGRLNNINMFIISIIFGLFLIILYSVGLDMIRNKNED